MTPPKLTLRRAALARRQALPATAVAQRSRQLRDHLWQHLPVAEWRWLHLFLPLPAKQEPDTWEIIQWVQQNQPALQLAVPVVQADGLSLRHYELTPGLPLIANRWGIPEPVAGTTPEVDPAQLDAVLVPLLYCDRAGQRVGYGGGFYDRFLAQCRPGTAFIGLNVLDEPPGELLTDLEPTDVPLTAYITPSGVWKFSQRSIAGK